MDVQVSLLYADLHSFGYMPKSGVARSNGGLTISFLRNFHADFHIRVFSPLTSLPEFVIICVFDDSHSDWGEIEAQYHFNLHFPMAKDVEHFFSIHWPFVLFDVGDAGG
jgi:hypothetical protein